MLVSGLAPPVARVARSDFTEIPAVFLQEHTWGEVVLDRWTLAYASR